MSQKDWFEEYMADKRKKVARKPNKPRGPVRIEPQGDENFMDGFEPPAFPSHWSLKNKRDYLCSTLPIPWAMIANKDLTPTDVLVYCVIREDLRNSGKKEFSGTNKYLAWRTNRAYMPVATSVQKMVKMRLLSTKGSTINRKLIISKDFLPTLDEPHVDIYFGTLYHSNFNLGENALYMYFVTNHGYFRQNYSCGFFDFTLQEYSEKTGATPSIVKRYIKRLNDLKFIEVYVCSADKFRIRAIKSVRYAYLTVNPENYIKKEEVKPSLSRTFRFLIDSKTYVVSVTRDSRNNCFVGTITNVPGKVSFQIQSKDTFVSDLRECVKNYTLQNKNK